ncbi:class E sortase [Streptomyces sp. KLOTTS4A1]|uniref:class E sortase n=1 Tax=Streptomyces sp. KLOTTS4A1 TaxID=3390996 RepID=UPI0039F5859F
MTYPRSGQGGSPYGEEYGERASYGERAPYGERASFEAAVDGLDDPLSDPLPGQHPSPWFRASAPAPSTAPQEPQEEWYDPQGYERDWYGERGAQGAHGAYEAPQGARGAYEAARGYGAGAAYPEAAQGPSYTGETPYTGDLPYADSTPYTGETSYTEETSRTEGASTEPSPQTAPHRPSPEAAVDDETVGLRTSDTRRTPRTRPVPGPSRLEARRAERAKRPSPAVLASRALGEMFISIGVLMLLFVTYQLWWTNVRAEQQANAETDKIQENWANGEGRPGAFEPGEGFAIMYIPKLDVVVPIAEGINKAKVLDRGMVGHYGEDSIKTAMPEDKQGNFAVAGHRNTHGEPFRYINKLRPGDPIVVETKDTYYVYKMASILPQTTPDNISVLNPVPKGSGFTKPGRYITLTTCTPEFTSTYRMIVWGELAEERPRDEGKPPALVQ